MPVLPELWDRIAATQAVPPFWVVAASAAVALIAVLGARPWHLTRNAITIAHEGGHALVSLLSGRRLAGIRLHSDTSGVTYSRGRQTGPGMVLTSAAGYLTPPLLGAGAAWLLAAHELLTQRHPGSRSRPGPSDADRLAGLTGVPGGVWVALFLLVSIAALILGGRLLVAGAVHPPRHLAALGRLG